MLVTTMRILFRIVAISIWLAILGTLQLIARFSHHNGFRELLATGTFGYVTILAWVLVIAVGPFAAIQLWRLRESGRKASLLLATSALLYYLVTGLLLRGPGPVSPKLWVAITGNATLVAILLSSPARRICQHQSVSSDPPVSLQASA
jgi:hypothetical protein